MKVKGFLRGQNWTQRMVTISAAYAVGTIIVVFCAYRAHSVSNGAAAAINVAGRQRMLNQRHAKEVFVVAAGGKVHMKGTRDLLITSANALANGGPTKLGMLYATSDPTLLQLIQNQLKAFELTFRIGDRILSGEATEAELLDATKKAHDAKWLLRSGQRCLQRREKIRNSRRLLLPLSFSLGNSPLAN